MRIAGSLVLLLVGIGVGLALLAEMRDPPRPGPGLPRPAGQSAAPAAIERPRPPQRVAEAPPSAGSLPERIAYPIAAKYAHEELSRVPHRLIGAWDARPEQEAPVDLRVFVLVVEPATSDAELEGLLRDAAARHRDCTYLRVQVFDSEAAARRPSWIDDGASRAEHLVAELVRMPDPTLAGLRVRGRRLPL
jgi:hypothetical protein